MLKLSILLFSTLAFSNAFGQREDNTTCSKRRTSDHIVKSASLSVAQIAETEKYNVHFYSLDIAMNNVVTDVAGTGEIHGITVVALDSVLFELHSNFSISEIRLDGSPVTYSRNGSAIKVPINAVAGTDFIVAIDYAGTPPTAGTTPFGGAGMTAGSSPTWGNHVVWSLSEPFSAYEWWPCKQSLTDKADSSQVKITVPDTCMAGSNGLLENVVDLGNGFKRFEWKHRHPIDYYLVSVAVAKYIEYTVYANPVGAPSPIMIQNFIYDNPSTLPNFQTRIDETADFIELFYELYGPYPFEDEKYGHCMAPLSGGMEHQTMTTQGFFEKGLTSHELGHQWWGDHVTCASWCDIWINEGFASYSEYLMLENLYPAEKDQHMLDVHDNVMSQAGGSVWVLDSLNENRIFSGRLTYDKGAAIIHTLRYLINDDVEFFNALRTFQTTYSNSTATGVDLMLHTETETALDLNSFFEQWYFGEGYPTYSVRWNQYGNNAFVQISHTASKPTVTATFTNPIDLRFVRPGQSDTIVRFDITSNQDVFYVENIGQINNSITIDPLNWLINKNGTIQNDPTLLGLTVQNDSAISIYPNPATNVINVEGVSERFNFSIYDMKGQVVKSGASLGSINLEALNNGIYVIEIDGLRKLIAIQ
jgi:aminopeptidase N